MKRSHGYYSKHSRSINARKLTPAAMLKEFAQGATVRINVNPHSKTGLVPLKYNGRLANIVRRQGGAYVIEFKDLNKTKRLTVAPIHLVEVSVATKAEKQ